MIRFTIYAFRCIAVFSFLYYIMIAIVSGIRTSFLWFWITAFITSVLGSFLLTYSLKNNSKNLLFIGKTISILFLLGIGLFILTEGILLYHGNKEPKNGADYAIILGAQVRGTVPSKTLAMRIRTAADYMKKNPKTIAICSGGQGKGEDITEAEAIKQGLLAFGISEERILLEEKSTNTVENLQNSKKFIAPATADVILITSDFHVFRAIGIAKKQGLTQISGGSAPEFLVTTPHYYLREFFAVIKDIMKGNMKIW